MANAPVCALQVRSPSGRAELLLMAHDVLFDVPEWRVPIRSLLLVVQQSVSACLQQCWPPGLSWAVHRARATDARS